MSCTTYSKHSPQRNRDRVQSLLPEVRRHLRGRSAPREAGAIPIGADVSSIIFLHASARAAGNDMSYRYIPNFPDTADLLGWYDVVYDDGFVDTVPVRFGVNILPLAWGRQPDTVSKGNARELSYAYEADVVECGAHTLFAYEWVNPRFGKGEKMGM